MELNENLFLEWVDDGFDWEYVDSKEVKDSDGFMTEYTWYKRLLPSSEEQHIFIFGDSDIYGPDDSYADAEFDSYDSAKEWFDNYYGFDHDEEDPDWVEFAEERPVKESLQTSLEALCQKHSLICDNLTEEEVSDFGIDIVNTYDEPVDYYCVDTGDGEQVVIAISADGKVMIEEDTDDIGLTAGDEYKDAAAFMDAYLANINRDIIEELVQVQETIEPDIESEELKALAQKHNIKILDAMENGDLRMEGAGADLMKFYQEAEKLGLWEVDPSLYECDNTVTETLTMHDFDEFKAIADEIGLVTAEDLERFRKEEMQPGESELEAIKRYKQELIDAGVDLSKLVNESLQEGAVKEIAMDIEAKESELKDLKGQLDQLKSYDRKECGAGGQFDSTTELDAEISDIETSIEKLEKELEELKSKVNA